MDIQEANRVQNLIWISLGMGWGGVRKHWVLSQGLFRSLGSRYHRIFSRASTLPSHISQPGVWDKAMKGSTCIAVGAEDVFLDMLRFRKTGPLLPLFLPAASWCCVRQDRGWPHPAPGPWLLWWSRGHPADATATSPHISARRVAATEGKGCRDALMQIGAWCMDVTGARYMEGSYCIAWH